MGLLRAYSKISRQQTACSRQGGKRKFLSTVYSLLSTDKKSLSTAYCLLSTDKKSLSTAYCLLSTEKGIALMMVLILSAIALAIMAGLIYMVISGTQISGMQKRYKTALEAGRGGADVTFQLIQARGDPGIPLTNFFITASAICLNDKLNKSTANWDAACNSSLTITPGACDGTPTSAYDMCFQLGAAPFPTYTVYSKIVDTVEGNSGGDEGLKKGSVVTAGGGGEIQVMSVPYLYTIEVDAENTANPAERAKLSVLYQY